MVPGIARTLERFVFLQPARSGRFALRTPFGNHVFQFRVQQRLRGRSNIGTANNCRDVSPRLFPKVCNLWSSDPGRQSNGPFKICTASSGKSGLATSSYRSLAGRMAASRARLSHLKSGKRRTKSSLNFRASVPIAFAKLPPSDGSLVVEWSSHDRSLRAQLPCHLLFLTPAPLVWIKSKLRGAGRFSSRTKPAL
jgi:hypothetical protein